MVLCGPVTADTVAARVSALGSSTDNIDLLYALEVDREEALALLVAQLTTVDDALVPVDFDEVTDADTRQVIWTVRALRYLTGERTSVPIVSVLDPEDVRSDFYQGVETASYFEHWETRGWLIILPHPEQEDAIAQWRVLVSRIDPTFVPDRSDLSWYY